MASFSSKRASRDARKPKSYIVRSGKATEIETQAADMADVSMESISTDAYRDLPSHLEIRHGQLKGRGMWSTQYLKRGTVLLTNRPHVSVLSTRNLPSYCSFCVSASKNEDLLKRCTKCRTIWYCSSTCQNEDWKFHKLECSAIRNWMSSSPEGCPPGEAVRSLGRVLWGRNIEGETSHWWKEIEGLQSHRLSLPPSAVELHTQLAHALVRYLGATSPAELAPYGLHSAGDLVDTISKFTTNTFTLTSPVLSPLGTCVSPIAALFNHSCLPNAVIVFPHSSSPSSRSPTLVKEPALHVVAIKDISPGEEVVTAYIDTSIPTSQRQSSLKETYNFTCKCSLCSHSGLDAREALWCPKSCGGMCSAPIREVEKVELPPQCVNCKAPFTQSDLLDIEDKRRIGQDALDKATALQFSDPTRALNLTSHVIPLLGTNIPPSAHPLLSLLRLHQSLLITSLSSSPEADTLNGAIRATARVVSGLTAVFTEGHPVRGVALTELGKLLAVDEPPSSSASSITSSTSSSTQHQSFPPTGAARLGLSVETLKRALKELMIGFGESTRGGQVGIELREEIVKLESEMNVWSRGVQNAWEDMAPLLNNNRIDN